MFQSHDLVSNFTWPRLAVLLARNTSHTDTAGHTKVFDYPCHGALGESRNVQSRGWDSNRQGIGSQSNGLIHWVSPHPYNTLYKLYRSTLYLYNTILLWKVRGQTILCPPPRIHTRTHTLSKGGIDPPPPSLRFDITVINTLLCIWSLCPSPFSLRIPNLCIQQMYVRPNNWSRLYYKSRNANFKRSF